MTPSDGAPARGSSWREEAACRGLGPEVFFDSDRWPDAREVCRRCPVWDACRDHAVGTNEPAGIWGGLTPDERHAGTACGTNASRDEVVRRGGATRGPLRRLDDEQLKRLFTTADPDRPAIEAIRTETDLSHASAYVYLKRARRLGAVEQRGRRLYPARR